MIAIAARLARQGEDVAYRTDDLKVDGDRRNLALGLMSLLEHEPARGGEFTETALQVRHLIADRVRSLIQSLDNSERAEARA